MKKKLSLYIFLVLMWSSNLYSYDIKIKRIECDYKSEKRHNNKFIIISPNEKKAKIYSVYDGRLWKEKSKFYIKEYDVSSDIVEIRFIASGEGGTRWVLDRKTGALSFRNETPQWWCSKMDDDFDPEKYVIEIIDKILEEQENKNKF